MSLRRLLGGAALVSLLVAGAASAQDFSAQNLSDHIKYLADDRLEGRDPGHVGEELTLDYLQAQYEALGLEPGGPNGEWRQAVPLRTFTPERPATAAWSRAGESHPLAATDIVLRAGARTDGDVRLQNVPLVFAGYGVYAPERGWDDYRDLDLTGKAVIILSGQPASFGEDPNFYGSGAHKTREALKRGAVGVITLVENPQAWERSARFGGRPRMTVEAVNQPQFTGSVSPALAQTWASTHGMDLTAGLAMAKAGGEFRAMDMGVTLDVDVDEKIDTITSYNLLAKIPGTERPDETVIYSAHWDHVGVGEPNADGDRIFNGAWDNASGTAALIEMAREFKDGPAPERTVVFLHVTAEEKGLLGSAYYGAHPVYPLETTAANINIDMLPFTPATRNIALFGFGKSSLEDDLARLAAAQGGRTVTGDGYPEEGFYYRSDHFNFAVNGVPALMPWTGLDLDEGGVAAGKALYEADMERYYHNLEDEWRADYDFTAALQNLTLLYELGSEVANSEEWPQWKPTAEFREIRAQSDAARQ